MRSVVTLLCCILFVPALSPLRAAGYWQQYVRYSMQVSLDPDRHLVSGEEEVTYHNNSPDVLEDLYLHLYPNAFKDETTLRSRRAIARHRPAPAPPYRSWIDITDFRISLQGKISRDFEVDETLLHAVLPAPLQPGDSLRLQLSFVHHVRRHLGRAGYRNDQYDMGQWYPKVAVYDSRGWDKQNWSDAGEFYGEFGDFRVTIEVPESFIVAATGVVIAGDPGWGQVTVPDTADYERWYAAHLKEKEHRLARSGRRTVTFLAKNVHDFAWSASPHFVYEHGKYKEADIHVLYRDTAGRSWHNKTVRHARAALEWLSEKFGPYPYPQVTVIHGLLGGGMEYPMLVMDGRADESLAVHEIGHIYFYGMLADDENAEAWLDEGFTTFQTRRYMEYHYGREGRNMEELNEEYPGHLSRLPRETRYEKVQESVIEMQLSGDDEPIAQSADAFGSSDAYNNNVYDKASLALGMLEYVMGEPAFWSGMRDYYRLWKFKHVTEQRFREVMSLQTDQDLDWFFEEWLHSTGFVDYALAGHQVKSLENGKFRVTVSLVQRGTYRMPVDVELRLRNGDTPRTRWFGNSRKGQVTFTVSSPAEKIILDPDNRILDVNRLNNESDIPAHEFLIRYPGIDYTPRDAYLVAWRPSIWYNDVDGAKVGLHLHGGYESAQKQLRIRAWYGAKSGTVDYDAEYSDLLYRWWPALRYHLRIARIEGRQWNAIGLSRSWDRAYRLLPRSTVSVGFRNIVLTDPAYPFYPWDAGVNNQVDAGYRLEFRGVKWTSTLNASVSASNQVLGSDFDFRKLSVEWVVRTARITPEIRGRLFAGTFLSDGRVPVQEQYGIADGGQYAYFHSPYARSRGSFFGLQNAQDFLRMPGDGNVRAFHRSSVPGADQLAAANLEIRFPLGNISQGVRASVLIFSDAAYASLLSGEVSGEYQMLADAGMGIQFRSLINTMPFFVRLDLPLWVNTQDYFGDQNLWQVPRLLVSFQSLF